MPTLLDYLDNDGRTKINVSTKDDWNFRNSSTNYSTHAMHTWLAAMIPQLARKLINLTRPTKLLDPFCGGGTVCVEAVLNRIPTAGIDVNPLSALITKAKITRVDEDEIYRILNRIENRVESSKFNGLFYPDFKEYLVLYWFKKEHLPILDSIARYIPEITDEKSRIFYQCIFSATIRDVSLTYRNEIRLRKLEPPDLRKFNRNVMQVFRRRIKDALIRLRTIPQNVESEIRTGDSKELPFKTDAFSTVICSPPYGDERNGVPYFQFVKNMLYWLGIHKKDLEKYRKNVLGKYDKRYISERIVPESNTLKELIMEISSIKQNVHEAIAFYSDYEKALKEMTRVTSDKIVIVIGNRVLNKRIVNNGAITTELLGNIGVKLVHNFVRELPSKRIPRFGDSRLIEGGQIDREDILVYSVK